jgi:hypothetical protein
MTSNYDICFGPIVFATLPFDDDEIEVKLDLCIEHHERSGYRASGYEITIDGVQLDVFGRTYFFDIDDILSDRQIVDLVDELAHANEEYEREARMDAAAP